MSEDLEENVATEGPVVEAKGFSITSMILGIVSVVLFCIWYLSIPCAVLAIIFAIIGKKRGAPGMATAGLVLGIIGLVLCIGLYLLAIIGVASMNSAITSYY